MRQTGDVGSLRLTNQWPILHVVLLPVSKQQFIKKSFICHVATFCLFF